MDSGLVNQMKMKRLLTSSFLILSAFAQYEDFTCNTYSGIPTGVCWQATESLQYYIECDGTDAVIYNIYDDESCGTSSDPSISYTISADDFNSSYIPFNCDNDDDEICDYAILRYYTDDDCTGDYFDGPLVMNQCYTPSSNASWKYSCSGNTLTSTAYTSGDCTGTSYTVSINYEDFSDSVSGCYEVCISFYSYTLHSALWRYVHVTQKRFFFSKTFLFFFWFFFLLFVVRANTTTTTRKKTNTWK